MKYGKILELNHRISEHVRKEALQAAKLNFTIFTDTDQSEIEAPMP
jgi:hypothetical protein